MIPYDSQYYETFVKASVSSEPGGKTGFSLTLNSGYLFSRDNEINNETSNGRRFEIDGGGEGWSLGGDFWLRYKVKESLYCLL